MLDGRILGLQWTQSVGGQQNFELHRILSDVSGIQWTEPVPVGIQAQTCWPADLGDGRVALTYTSREGRKPGVSVAGSSDQGLSWDLDNQLQVWDAVVQEFLGSRMCRTIRRAMTTLRLANPNLPVCPTDRLPQLGGAPRHVSRMRVMRNCE